MKRYAWGILALVVALSGLGAAGWAAGVSIDPVTITTKPGFYFTIPINLTKDQAVAGINGELSYDPAQFQNPSIVPAAGGAGFTTLGNSPQAGKFRFVMYADPTAPLPAGNLTFIRIQTANVIPTASQVQMTYTIAAASTLAGVSIAPVTFNNVTVNINQAAVGEWTIYQ